MNKRITIDWEHIPIKLVQVDKNFPNECNPYARLSAKERERSIVSLCGKIWARHINEVTVTEAKQ